MMINDFFDKVVVINIDRRVDRMQRLVPQLEELGILYERYSAFDALELNIKAMHATKDSHVSVWKENSEMNVLVLEDDALFCEGFNEKFAEAIKLLPEDWDVLYLGVFLHEHFGKLEPVNDLWGRQVATTGLQAYCINKRVVNKLIEELQDYQGHIDIGLMNASGYNSYVCTPNLVTQFPSFSDIRMRQVNDFQ